MATPFIGQILLVGFNFAPINYLACDGSLQQISDNTTLFNLIGTTYGGDGVRTYGLPDLRGRVTVHQGQGTGLGPYVMGQLGGVENVTLVSAQMTQHTHNLMANPGGANLNNPTNAIFAGTGSNLFYSDQAPATALNTGMVSSAGGNQPHSNQQPFQVCNWIIAQYGIYPTQ
jgi:microcystin-dependent protein